MRRALLTQTGRGLRLALYGEVSLGLGAALYFLLGRSNRVALVGFLVAGLFGLFSARNMSRGRHEFGPDHAITARWGTRLFALAAIFFSVAFLSGLTTFSETHRVRDLVPAAITLGLAVMLEGASGAAFLHHLVGSKRRALPIAYGAAGIVFGIFLLVRGYLDIQALEARAGPVVSTDAAARARLGEFLDGFLPWVMGTFLVTRVAAFLLVRLAIEEVQQAEQDAVAAEGQGEGGPRTPPTP